MATSTSTVTLHNGVKMPLVGLGTFQAHSSDVRRAVHHALDNGYIRIDTAAVYRNEKDIGAALKERGTKRENVFITTKVPPTALSFDGATQSCLTSLSDLNVDYVDLLLIHWPAKSGLQKESAEHLESRKAAWKALEALYDQGKCKAIGVNKYWRIKPAVNQVECHPFLQQAPIRQWCSSNEVLVEAYSSLGRGDLLENEVVKKVAGIHNKTPAQVLLKWGLHQNLAVIPKSVTPERIKENIQLFDFTLSEVDIASLSALECNHHYCWDPSDVK